MCGGSTTRCLVERMRSLDQRAITMKMSQYPLDRITMRTGIGIKKGEGEPTIPRIHHNGIRPGLHIHPPTTTTTPIPLLLNLQPPPLILKQKSQRPIIAMGPGPHPLPAFEPARRHGRIMQQPQIIIPDIQHGIEEMRIQAHAHGNAPHEHEMQFLAFEEECLHREAKCDAVAIQRVGPRLRVARLRFPADLVGFFHVVAGLLAFARDVRGGGGEADFFAARALVAAVCGRVG